ncbi:hypothetical protein [Paenarthrobacter sp. A20]|uniref:hypothetical protein n=1 Tax=Paenarthrobacter sp. A20 TaxID=2817891 RepID=UPI0020A15A10|nr:hypothetical protein [Paenarthrobacter sp. A20]MCP1414390.1 hypothetical protein [Paenarthrobacter sp. A20]
MKLRLKANNPLVVKAARERSRILKELGKTVDPKTARIAKLKPITPKATPTTDDPKTIIVGDDGDETFVVRVTAGNAHELATSLRSFAEGFEEGAEHGVHLNDGSFASGSVIARVGNGAIDTALTRPDVAKEGPVVETSSPSHRHW